MRIGSIGLRFPLPDVPQFAFHSDQSLLDFDLVLWDPAQLLQEYMPSKTRTLNGLPILPHEDSERLKGDVERRKAEFTELFKLGRSVIVFTPRPQSWQREIFRPNVNPEFTIQHLVNALPHPLLLEKASGREITLRNARPGFADFWNVHQNSFAYRAILPKPPGESQLVIAGTDKVVSTILNLGAGHLLYLPFLSAIESYGLTQTEARTFIVDLVRLIKGLKTVEGDFELPSWASGYQLQQEVELRDALQISEEAHRNLLAQLDKQRRALTEVESWKLLFTGTGPALERAVRQAFEALGFDVNEGAPGRDDLIARYRDSVAVIEVKGTVKSASERNAAQLEKWVSEYIDAHGVQPKGILVVNAFRDLPLNERTETSFPDQMLGYSARRDHCLITGVQLLGAVLEVQRHPAQQQNVIDGLLQTTGVYGPFATWAEFLRVS
jgi:hypothetical protein